VVKLVVSRAGEPVVYLWSKVNPHMRVTQVVYQIEHPHQVMKTYEGEKSDDLTCKSVAKEFQG